MIVNVAGTFLEIEGRDAFWITLDQCVPVEASGESFNQTHIERLIVECGGRLGVPLVAWLVPEPENQHDKNAILLWVRGGKVGYLPRDLAAVWNSAFHELGQRAQRPIACAVHLRLPNKNEQGYQVVVWLPKLPTQDVPVVELGEIPIVMLKAEEVRLLRERRRGEAEAKEERAKSRRAKRLSAFDESTLNLIEQHRVWRGQTREMLDLSCGKPDRVQEKVLKTKTKYLLEYDDVYGVGLVCEKCDGEGRIAAYKHINGGLCFRCGGTGTGSGWALKVSMDDDSVVGWEDRRSRSVPE